MCYGSTSGYRSGYHYRRLQTGTETWTDENTTLMLASLTTVCSSYIICPRAIIDAWSQGALGFFFLSNLITAAGKAKHVVTACAMEHDMMFPLTIA